MIAMASLQQPENKYLNELLKKLSKVAQFTENLMSKVRLCHGMGEKYFHRGSVVVETVQLELKNLDNIFTIVLNTQDNCDILTNMRTTTEPVSDKLGNPGCREYGFSNEQSRSVSTEECGVGTNSGGESPNSNADVARDTTLKWTKQREERQEFSDSVETAKDLLHETAAEQNSGNDVANVRYVEETDTRNQDDNCVTEPTPHQSPIANHFTKFCGVKEEEQEDTGETMEYYVAYDGGEEFDEEMSQITVLNQRNIHPNRESHAVKNEEDTITAGIATGISEDKEVYLDHSQSEVSQLERALAEKTLSQDIQDRTVPSSKPQTSSPSSVRVLIANNTSKRKWDKYQYCVYCKGSFSRVSRHFKQKHRRESDVAAALQLPKGSKERKAILQMLVNKGNHAHNIEVLKKGKGWLVPYKRPTYNAPATDYSPCQYCLGYFMKTDLRRHRKSCIMKK
ncbi:uncharacterized protein [Ptychodera flava]|uniref:uncharacterized protein isoform X1 n=1 Tax=Ptychodera flava TaxID=63121 RepID=UPI00396A3DEB